MSKREALPNRSVDDPPHCDRSRFIAAIGSIPTRLEKHFIASRQCGLENKNASTDWAAVTSGGVFVFVFVGRFGMLGVAS